MRIEHAAMYVKDLEKAKDFFIKYFGAVPNEGYHNKNTDFRSYFLSFDEGARLEIMTRPSMDDAEKTPDRDGTDSSGLRRRKRRKGGRADSPAESGRL